jgi:hypothetical protein
MEQNILESLKGLEGKVKGTPKSAYTTLEYGGCIKIERGNFSMEIDFYAKLSETKHKGIISIDDWDVHDSDEYNLNGLPIDNISAFKTKLNEWGLSGIGNKLQFSSEEQKRAIAMAMLEDETLKKMFGKKFKVWNLLSVDEQKLLDLQYVVANFKDCGEHIRNEVAKHYKIGEVPQTTPTLEEFELKLAELSK